MALQLCFPRLPCNFTASRRSHTISKPPTNAHSDWQFTTAAQPQRTSSLYPPSLWDNHSIQSLQSDHLDETLAKRFEELKEEVRHLFSKEREATIDQLELIDTLQQLGVAYHFEKEIKNVLGSMPTLAEDVGTVLKDKLHSTALLFRILREHGYFVSQDVFDSFKDATGNFKAGLCEDKKGMLSLHEASFLSTKGEDKLEDARAFTTNHLKGLVDKSLDLCLREHLSHALELPMSWRVPRVHTRWFINMYEMDEDMNPILLEFAWLDFNMVQGIHQRELKNLSRWWTSLGLGEKLSFARERVMECFVYTVGWAFEPKFLKFREGVTKLNTIITTVDDVYDLHGSIDELELFTNAVERWDVKAMEQLPEYMKICYLALFNSMNEFAYDILREKGMDIIPYLKKAWADHCNSYLVEAKWYHSGFIPKFNDYMDNASITIGQPTIQMYSYFSVSQDITNQALECLKSGSNLLYHSAKIFRLLNDLGTSTAEMDRGDVPKSIQCLMHEHGVSEVVAREMIQAMVIDSWKEINGERFAISVFEDEFRCIIVNFPRMAHCMYHNGDEFGHPDRDAKDRVASVVVEPISLKWNCLN